MDKRPEFQITGLVYGSKDKKFKHVLEKWKKWLLEPMIRNSIEEDKKQN